MEAASGPEREEMTMVQLQARWDDHMGEPSQAKRHKKALVLILYWDKIEDSYMDVEDEISRLDRVLSDRYHYTVRKQCLNDPAEKGKAAQLLLNKYLAIAACDADRKDSLLIVYYAGHGNPTPDGRLLLTGGNPRQTHPGAKVDGVVWQKAEELVHTAESPDILLIFDCCFAGRLAGTFQRSRFATRNFEFLGATSSRGLTRIPGKYSFTNALIHAFDKLADTKDVFTISQLQAAIIAHEDFPSDTQTPVLTERGEASATRLSLAPLAAEDKFSTSTPPLSPCVENNAFEFGLCLQFTYDLLPNPNDIERLALGLKHLMRVHDITAKHINWKGIYRKGQSRYDMSWVVLQAVEKLKRPLRTKHVGVDKIAAVRDLLADMLVPSSPTDETPTQRKMGGRVSKRQPPKASKRRSPRRHKSSRMVP